MPEKSLFQSLLTKGTGTGVKLLLQLKYCKSALNSLKSFTFWKTTDVLTRVESWTGDIYFFERLGILPVRFPCTWLILV